MSHISKRDRAFDVAIEPRDQGLGLEITLVVPVEKHLECGRHLVGVGPADVRIGMEVHVLFEPTDGEMAVPVFAPAGGRQ